MLLAASPPDASAAVRTARLAIARCSDGDERRSLARLLSDPLVAPSLFAALRGSPHAASAATTGWFVARRHDANADADLIGAIHLDDARLAYCVAPDAWGRGYGRELVGAACATLAAHAGFAVLTASVLRDNRASVRLLERHGFRFQGLRRQRWADAPGLAEVLTYVGAATHAPG